MCPTNAAYRRRLVAGADAAQEVRHRLEDEQRAPHKQGCAGTIKLPKTGKVVRSSKRKVALVAHKRTKVTLKLSKKNAALVRKALRQRRKVVAKIALSATAPSGDTSRKTMSIRLRP
jgi:hypothetical protein